jgi:hypothetical protein
VAQISTQTLGPFRTLVPSGPDGEARVNVHHVDRIVRHLRLMRDGELEESTVGVETLVGWAQAAARIIQKRRGERVQSTSIYFAVAADAFREAFGHLPKSFVEVRDGRHL